jgi:zona occludens toxin
MAIVIRHGSNGAMKSATAVDLYMIPAIKEGRPVVTNLRGVSLERCYEVFPHLPENLEVIYVDTETTEGKDKMACWFHWAPIGALLIFDEASSLFPKSWRESRITALDYPGGLEAAKKAGRPSNWLEAWEMQRHYNWDVVLTTPNIKNIRDDIRNTTPMAYRQRSLGKFASEKLRMYKQVQHDATKNGFSAADAISVSTGKVSKQAFQLYDSTKTGSYGSTKMGASSLASPKILLLGGVLLLAGFFAFSAGTPSFADEAETVGSGPVVIPAENVSVAVPARSESAPGIRGGGLSLGGARSDDPLIDPLENHHFRLLGKFNGTSQILITGDGDSVQVTPKELSALGYAYFPVSDCVGRLVSGSVTRVVLCGSADSQSKKEPEPMVSES